MSGFADFCVYDGSEKKTPKGDDLFVGVKIIKTENPYKFEPWIFFPRGYRPDSSLTPEEKDAELKADFFRLLSIISEEPELNAFPDDDKDDKKIDFPIHAFFSVIQYYLDFGYFVETEHIYKKGWSGKINWSKTIKNIKPQVIQDEDGRYNLIYLDLITRRANYKENNLVTLIHKYCAFEATKTIGPLLGITEDELEMPEIDFDPELFDEVLREKISSTFNDRFLELFQSMLVMVNYLKNKENRAGDDSEVSFGYKKFDRAWEKMVDRIFRTVADKSKFDPHLRFVAENDRNLEGLSLDDDGDTNEKLRSTLRPDTIMKITPERVAASPTLCDDDVGIYVLDSKYYKFGVKRDLSYLPGAESVCKQMAYAEYARTHLGEIPGCAGITADRIYNAFIMPCCAAKVNQLFPNAKIADNSIYGMRRVGYVYGDWKDRGQDYHKIHCILLDMKSVMRNYANNVSEQEKLAKLVRPE